jgi:hypothetical protein
MSLHKFAEQVAASGRGDDSLLVHMTPDEVQRLQKFAEANGRTLTINPETGLPEAGFLSDLFKAVAPIALGAFLGPAGLAFGGPGLSAAMAGVATGGITALATGSLSRGLMAGLGAYGGAGLGESLMGAGDAALGAQAASQGAGLTGDMAFNLGDAGITDSGIQSLGNVNSAAEGIAQNRAAFDPTKLSTMSRLGAGAQAVVSDPTSAMDFAKNNWKSLAAAAAPIMAGQMVPTTTKMPVDTNPAYIRQKLYDPYTQTYKSLAPVKASEFGSRNFSDAYTNPQTGQMATLDQRQPTPMAGGGIVALARGGVPGYAVGGAPTILSDEALYQKTGSWEAAAAARDAQNNALNAYNWQQQADARDQAARASNIMADAERLRAATNTNTAVPVDYNALATNFVNTAAANPNITTADFITGANTAKIGLTQPLATALDKSGLSAASQYALTHADIGDAGNVEETYGGLKGLSSNINYTLGAYNADAANKGKTGLQKQADALAAMNKYGINEADIKRATGKTIAELFPSTLTKPISVIPGGTQLPGATVYDNGAYGNYGSGPATGVDYRGNTVSIATPGDIITNPDGSSTVVPNIPGRPYGGFTGSEQVKSRYTAGGGSLGYTAKAPKTMAEFNEMFNNQTGDSLAAYNFLMGKGKNLAQVNAESNKTLMQPYFTGSNRYKPKFLSYDKDGQVVSSGTSGKTGDAKAAELTKAKTIDIVDDSGNNREVYTAVLQEDGSYLAGNGKRYDVTGKQIAAGGGMMGYAMGGGLGSLGSYSDGGRLLKGPGDGVSDSIPATIGSKNQPARLADGEFVIPARIVSELGNGSTDAGAKKLYAMMDRVQRARGKTTGKNKVAANSRADKHLPA